MATLKLSLRPGERIFVNGAVMRVDRKVSLELLNDATFLLESHVMQAHEATTPLRQLYFLVQTMLIAPEAAAQAADAFRKSYPLLMAAFSNASVRDGLMDVADHVERERPFEALRALRALIPAEDAILAGKPVPTRRKADEAVRQLEGATA
ncbi:flagellar biosynthesis repressor FlbT [Aureimonas leprariae]|uniref:Probable flagellum biosynthesis repressor protein FlbT n=1 Tax=Plantimonas leprariae TaxID=2615207 RepID=A0A7V7PPE9_9HYPH|nr:flagellar biosynthesis repressor FlbT [Aureimonas leprariae]KAB0679893.1 flagellar biosynthesis repressor FlbT [Aureimonas leprariae]